MTIPSWDGPDFVASDGGYAKYSGNVVALADGNFVVVWSGFRSADDDPDGGMAPVARIFDADRNPLGEGFVVPDDLDGSQADYLLSATADGGFAVAYTDRNSDVGTFLARFDKTGSRIGEDAKITDATGLVGLAGLSDGSMMVLHSVFGSERATIATVVDDSNLAGAGKVLTGVPSLSVGAENVLDAVGDGAAFIALSGPSSATKAELFRLDAEGEIDSTTPLFDDDSLVFANRVSRVMPDGRAVVAASFDQDGASLLNVRLFDTDGSILGDATLDPDPDQNYPSQIVPAPDGGFVLLMTSGDINGPEKQNALGLKFDSDGAVEGSAFKLHRDPDGYQSRAHGAWLDGGDFMVVWDEGTTFTNQIVAQGFDPSGLTAGNAPTDIVLSGDPIAPGLAGQAIGTLSAVDADADETHTFTLADPFVSSYFVIEGDVLRFSPGVEPTEVYPYDRVEIRVTDAQFNIYDEVVEIPFVSVDPEPEGVTRNGTKKNDKLKGAGGDDLLKGKGGKDKLLARGGDDDLQGGGGRDLLKGQGGDDRLDGGKGRDKLIGGGGADVFVLDGKGGPDRVRDFADGLDLIEIASGAESFEDLRLARRGDSVLIKDGGKKLGVVEDVSRADLDETDFLFS